MDTLPEMPAYEDETVPVYRCRQVQDGRTCNHVFALRSSPVSLRGSR
jgi:hypothetical protein